VTTRRRRNQQTVVRGALRPESALQPSVCDGLGAVATAHRDYIHESIRVHFNDSLDLDEALREGHEQENRWDYLLGHSRTGEVVAAEPHSAKQDQVSTVIRKKKAALVHLRDHLRNGARVSRWLWISSGKVQFANTEKTTLLLAQNGIQFVGRAIREKDLRR
jgi:hypothetical protein